MTEFTTIAWTAALSALGALIVAAIIAASTGVFRVWRIHRDQTKYAAARGEGLQMVEFSVHITGRDSAEGFSIGFPQNWIGGDSEKWRRGLAHDLRMIADYLQETWEQKQRGKPPT